jgi:ABC-2 type transport system permease protein
MLNKYKTTLQTSISNSLAYPARFYGFLLGSLGSLTVYVVIWKAVFSNNETFLGYTFSQMILYYTTLLLFRNLLGSGKVATSLGRMIKDGDVSNFLTKPINFNLYFLVSMTSQRIVIFITPLIIFIVMTVFLNNQFLNPISICTFTISIFMAVLLNHYIYSCVGAVAFFTTNTWGIKSIFGRFIDIFSGGIFPLDILPTILSTILVFLPFSYMQFAPISIYTKNLSGYETFKIILIQTFWLILVYFLYKFIFTKGTKKYEAIGI